MRKEYRRAIRERVAAGLERDLPAFKPVKIQSRVLFGGESVFRWPACSQLHCFILLVPSPTGRQAFTLELAWSDKGRFPDVTSRPTVMVAPGDPPPIELEEAIVRLGALAGRGDLWWELPDPALERPGDIAALQESIEPLSVSVATERAVGPVNEALQVLSDVGLTFFEALAKVKCAEASGSTDAT